MISRLTLRRFKAFNRFTVQFPDQAILVGPNSAGKSTIVSALRSAAGMLRYARARKPSSTARDGSAWHKTYPLDETRLDLEEENIRFEFHSESATRLELAFSGGRYLTAVWPEESAEEEESAPPFFYLAEGTAGNRKQPGGPLQVKKSFPLLAAVPPLSPLELHERIRDDDYVKASMASRLASRHFRNQLSLLDRGELGQNSWEGFAEFSEEWLPEISFETPSVRFGERTEIDLFYKEGRTPKELAWAGDGYQVFLQFLFHLYLNRGVDAIILDEPDLYLHADLQRRLVQLLDGIPPQVILATHSTELLVEASPTSVIWIDKSRARAISTKEPVALQRVSEQIGSRFNIRLAKTLRAKVVVFVEGKDMKLLQNVASTLGAEAVAREQGIAIVPVEGFSNWRRVEGFGWLVEHLLEGSLEAVLVLDRDYYSEKTLDDIRHAVRASKVQCHIWQRKELESYFLHQDVLARLSGADPGWIWKRLLEHAEELRHESFAQMQARYIEGWPRDRSSTEALAAASKAWEELWDSPEERVFRSPGKELFGRLSSSLQAEGHRGVSARTASRSIRSIEVDPEMISLIRNIDAMATGR